MPTIKKKVKRERIVEIDFARGIFVWFMMIDHLFYDFWGIVPNFFTPVDARIIALNNFAVSYWTWPVRIGARFAILSMFFLISGICTYFSRNRLKRGLIVLAVGIVISIGFYLFGISPMGDGEYIFFGAITCFGVSLLIYWFNRFLFEKLCPKHKQGFKWIALGIGIVIIAIGLMFDCWNISNNGAVPLGERINAQNFFLAIIGYRQDSMATDWLPLFPYLGFMFVGSFIGETLYKNKKSYFKPLPARPKKNEPIGVKVAYYGGVMPYKGIKNVFAFSGRYSLFFYILHQVVLILILGIILLAMGYSLKL